MRSSGARTREGASVNWRSRRVVCYFTSCEARIRFHTRFQADLARLASRFFSTRADRRSKFFRYHSSIPCHQLYSCVRFWHCRPSKQCKNLRAVQWNISLVPRTHCSGRFEAYSLLRMSMYGFGVTGSFSVYLPDEVMPTYSFLLSHNSPISEAEFSRMLSH